MIKTETITIRGRQMARTYSDAGMMIERDGVRYSEAVDPIGSGRTYTETDEPVPEEPMDLGQILADAATQPTQEERLAALESAMLTMMMGGITDV